MTKLDYVYTSYTNSKFKSYKEILWNSETAWAEYVSYQLNNLDFKWSESGKYIFIYILVKDLNSFSSKIDGEIKRNNFKKDYLGEYIILKLDRNNAYCYLPELWSRLQNTDELLKFVDRTDSLKNKSEFDTEIQKIIELLSQSDMPSALQSLKISDLSILKN